MYRCKYFTIKELVSKKVYNEREEKAWALLDERTLWVIDRLRNKFGPITINDWSWDGNNEDHGFRESYLQSRCTILSASFWSCF